MNEGVLENVLSYCYLGIRVNSQLDFQAHITQLFHGACTHVYTLQKIRKFIDTRTALIIFKAYILSRVEYGSLFCIGVNASCLDKLQKLINRGLRICLKLPYTSNVAEMHVRAKLLPLKLRRCISLMKLMHTISRDPENIVAKRDRFTRSELGITLKCPFPYTEMFRKCISYQGPVRWNELPRVLRDIDAPDMFKVKVKDYYLEKFLEAMIV